MHEQCRSGEDAQHAQEAAHHGPRDPPKAPTGPAFLVATAPRADVGTVERAFQPAPGSVTVEEIRAMLRREGCAQVEEHLSGNVIRAELRRLLAGSARKSFRRAP